MDSSPDRCKSEQQQDQEQDEDLDSTKKTALQESSVCDTFAFDEVSDEYDVMLRAVDASTDINTRYDYGDNQRLRMFSSSNDSVGRSHFAPLDAALGEKLKHRHTLMAQAGINIGVDEGFAASINLDGARKMISCEQTNSWNSGDNVNKDAASVESHFQSKPRRFCHVEGCKRVIKSQGLCQKHGAKTRLCKIDGCTKQAQGGFEGMCSKCFERKLFCE